MKARQEQIWATTQTIELLIKLLAHVGFVLRRGIAQMLFDVAMTVFFGIEFRRARRQRLDGNLRMLS